MLLNNRFDDIQLGLNFDAEYVKYYIHDDDDAVDDDKFVIYHILC